MDFLQSHWQAAALKSLADMMVLRLCCLVACMLPTAPQHTLCKPCHCLTFCYSLATHLFLPPIFGALYCLEQELQGLLVPRCGKQACYNMTLQQ